MKNHNRSESEKYLGMGLQLAVTILAGFFAGIFVDRRFGTMPWGILGGTVAGFVLGFVNFLFQYRSAQDQNEPK